MERERDNLAAIKRRKARANEDVARLRASSRRPFNSGSDSTPPPPGSINGDILNESKLPESVKQEIDKKLKHEMTQMRDYMIYSIKNALVKLVHDKMDDDREDEILGGLLDFDRPHTDIMEILGPRHPDNKDFSKKLASLSFKRDWTQTLLDTGRLDAAIDPSSITSVLNGISEKIYEEFRDMLITIDENINWRTIITDYANKKAEDLRLEYRNSDEFSLKNTAKRINDIFDSIKEEYSSKEVGSRYTEDFLEILNAFNQEFDSKLPAELTEIKGNFSQLGADMPTVNEIPTDSSWSDISDKVEDASKDLHSQRLA